MTKHYADHNNLDEEALGQSDRERTALDKAIRINTTDEWKELN